MNKFHDIYVVMLRKLAKLTCFESAQLLLSKLGQFLSRECVRAGAAGSRTRRSSGDHILNPQNFCLNPQNFLPDWLDLTVLVTWYCRVHETRWVLWSIVWSFHSFAINPCFAGYQCGMWEMLQLSKKSQNLPKKCIESKKTQSPNDFEHLWGGNRRIKPCRSCKWFFLSMW